LLNNMMMKHFLHVIKPERIYIFSKTASFDLTYRPMLSFMVDNSEGPIHIYDSIDMGVIGGLVEAQKKIKKNNMTMKKSHRKTVEKLLFIYDDILGDSQLKSYQSDLATFTTISRHSAITNIFLT